MGPETFKETYLTKLVKVHIVNPEMLQSQHHLI